MDNLLGYQAFASARPAASPSLRTVTELEMFVLSLLAGGMPRKYGMRPPRKTKPRLFGSHLGMKWRSSISSRTGHDFF